MDLRVTRARKIYSDGRHSAFTGIADFRGRTYVVFRSATTHVSGDGNVRVIGSSDRESWEVVAEKSEPPLDLRDPKVVVFRDRLYVYARGRVFASDDGATFSDPEPLRGEVDEGVWIWWVAARGGVMYGAGYRRPADGAPKSAALYASDDGLAWRKLADFPVEGGGEVSFDFDRDGTLWALVRTDHAGQIPSLCVAPEPYDQVRVQKRLPMRLQGPMLKRLTGGCVIICRQWDLPGRCNTRTELFWLADGRDPVRLRALPSGGDTSYAGWLDLAPGRAVVSYYSSHEYKMDAPPEEQTPEKPARPEHTTPADIFLADVAYR